MHPLCALRCPRRRLSSTSLDTGAYPAPRACCLECSRVVYMGTRRMDPVGACSSFAVAVWNWEGRGI